MIRIPHALTLAWFAAIACAVPAAASSPVRPGSSVHGLRSGGFDREYALYVPASYDGSTAVPLVIDLHGSGSNPKQEAAISGSARAADARGFVVAYPIAAVPRPEGGFTWNVPPAPERPDDVAFVRDVLDDVAWQVNVDPARVWVLGLSGGGRLASQIACDLADRVGAVGVVGGLRHPDGCAPRRAVPIVAFHGTADPVNPYGGGGPAYWGEGVDEALLEWADDRGCAGVVDSAAVADGVVRVGRETCGLVLYRLDGAGHTWPGTRFPFPVERFGDINRAIDATSTMLDLFDALTPPTARGRD